MWYESLEEQRVWEYFQDISQIPRESGDEKGVREYLISWAKEHQVEASTDELGNVVLFKEGDKAKEPICLQGHMDMVCVKTDDSKHDFSKDPIKILYDDGFIKAKDTSLGADNGIAIAIALALLEEADETYPSIEALFTVAEETGLTGAYNVKPELLRSRRMINLDSEEEGVIYIGCAGGIEIDAKKKAKKKKHDNHPQFKLSISGLLGGHSGGEIHKQRANAIQLLARIMHRLPTFCLTDIKGGTRRNVIPSTAYASFIVSHNDIDVVETVFENAKNEILQEYSSQEPNISITLERAGEASDAIKAKLSALFIEALYLTHHGVDRMSLTIDNVVETSNNLAIVEYKDDHLYAISSTRSLVESRKNELAMRVGAIFDLVGFKVVYNGSYPGWQPNEESKLKAKVAAEYKKFTKKAPHVTCIHAGLECGIINSQIPNMDSLSLGPNIYDAHSVNERVDVQSVVRMMRFLRHLLKAI